ncbi:autoinducer binding domain-containing protein [Ramlibacter sp.]|uniref:autoinducer binding domain-containing protein n=1 Tax=Ramlibacter sp. TaxID=1917967 RepID=UPI0017CBC4B3|nr:autoinducer binding domain-containing protein [Ramlibacter sp.]MBA2675213.1 autoinducer binding domain-containing protein [Ramlibacter sp.]
MTRIFKPRQADQGPPDAVQVRQAFIEGRRVSLSVLGDGAHGFRLERRRQGCDEPVSVLHLDLQDGAQVQAFIDNDPYAPLLKNEYRAALDTVAEGEWQAEGERMPEFASECDSERDLLVLMRNFTRACGAANCYYHWFCAQEEGGEITRHDMLVGGAPSWAHRYVHQHWYLNDPAVAHARENTQPLRGSSLVLPAHHWLLQSGPEHGLGSCLFFPAHRRDDTTFGLLHVSTPLAPPQGEDHLWRNRRLLRGLANELLEWRVLRGRQELARQLSLSYTEVVALRMVERGGNARHVAEELKIGERAVYQLFVAINRKLNSKHIKSSASKAKQCGLLSSPVQTVQTEEKKAATDISQTS